jgi:Holliday junction resolvase RusA-like endonuclease
VEGLAAIRANAHDEIFPGDCPVYLSVDFYLPRPASRKKEAWPAWKPDLDKLVRTVGDSLVKAHVLEEDSRICQILATKRYEEVGIGVGAWIAVRPL